MIYATEPKENICLLYSKNIIASLTVNFNTQLCTLELRSCMDIIRGYTKGIPKETESDAARLAQYERSSNLPSVRNPMLLVSATFR